MAMPMAWAKIPSGAQILTVDGQPVHNWFDIHTLLKKSGGSSTLSYQALDVDGKPIDSSHEVKLQLDSQEQQMLANARYTHELALAERIDVRQTSNPLTAAAWGVTETRDLLLQFYVTLRRLVQGSVSATNLMGPIGIVHAGSLFAFKGWDWLLWFLAMISANLAVVNFLPIPIVDGGLFTFLIIEKIAGRPLSARAQTVAQIVGLAIILSVFLLVTYQDIARIWM
jgi:regulator of sigma E protease